MTDNQFDNFIRAKLKDHSAPVPPGLWEKIHPEDKDDRKGILLPKRNLLRFLIIAAFLVALSVGGYLYFNQQITKEQEQPVSKAGDNHSGDITTNNNITNHSNKVQGPSLPATKSNNETPATASVNGNTTVIKHNSEQTAAQVISPSSMNGRKLSVINPSGNDTHTKIPFVSKAIEANMQVTEETNALDEDITAYTGSHLSAASTISYLKNGFFDLKNIQDKHISGRPVITCPSVKGGGGNPEWNIEIYASPDIAFKSIQNKTATQQYLQKKDSSERMQIGYSAGFRIVKPITDNLLFKAGLQYSQINEKFTYRTENEVKTTTVVTQRTIIRGPGDTVVVSDTSILRQIGYRTNTINNRFRSIDIPVTVGYQFGDDDLHFGINAGVIFNLSSWYQGVVLDSSLATVPISKGTNAVYKNNIGMGLYAGFSILKRINDDTHLFFEPYFRYNLSGITNSQSSYNQKFNVGGLSIGLRYNLNRR